MDDTSWNDDDTMAESHRWQTLLDDVYTKAQAAMPDNQERLTKALALVQSGRVMEGHNRDTYKVQSMKDPGVSYLVDGLCSCPDVEQAPGKWCKHRIAAALYKRTYTAFRKGVEDLRETPTPQPPTASPSPHERLSRRAELLERYTWHKGETKAIRYIGLLLIAQEEGLVSLSAVWSYNDESLSLATATAKFKDGSVWTDSGDATPNNVSGMVKPHFRRMALTRAKARCLRDALGLEMVADEELGD